MACDRLLCGAKHMQRVHRPEALLTFYIGMHQGSCNFTGSANFGVIVRHIFSHFTFFPHLLKKIVFWMENKAWQGTWIATLMTVIHAGVWRWCKRSPNVNAAVIRVVLIPRAWRLSMHQSQPCVSRGEPTGINLEPEVKVLLLYPHGHKLDQAVGPLTETQAG